MPTRTGKVGPQGLIEVLRDLADEWDEVSAYRDCARELRATLNGYEGGEGGGSDDTRC